jgi:nucleoside-diphosphate-sugar epimerase
MKILVIGSEGNIGVPLVKHLRDHGHDVIESDIKQGFRSNYIVADICQPLDLMQAFERRPDVVYLLSAIVSRVTCEQAASLAISTNLTGSNNVLQLCKKFQAKLVYFSTSEVYGPDCNPMDESEPDPRPNNRYGLTKYLGEKLIEYEVRNYGLQAVTVRPFMFYDEMEELGDHRSAMIRFATNLAEGKPIEVHRGSYRGWLHVDDAVRALEACYNVKEYTVINIGHPDIRPIEDLAEMVRAYFNASKELLIYKDLPERMTLKKYPILKRQEEILGFEPNISLEEGLKRVSQRFQH